MAPMGLPEGASRTSYLARNILHATGGAGGNGKAPDVLPEGARSPPSFIGDGGRAGNGKAPMICRKGPGSNVPSREEG